ncbi:MAG TPA: L-rhamnose isomerase [Armatimonadota bacterium]|jgi:L-rhamnose isomerase/sugar isomerase
MDQRLLDAARKALELPVELPSWGFGNSGTRFGVFLDPTSARNTQEKIQDAATVNRYTGGAPSVALHIPWDKCDDWAGLAGYAEQQGVKLGAINPNVFQDQEYRLGSATHPDPAVRAKAVAHMVECAEICALTGSRYLSLWFADGTNYPGQDSILERRRRLKGALEQVYAKLPPQVTMLIEYKLFEPGFYTTDLADWGSAFTLAKALGPRAKVLVDTGHHAPGTNIAYIVALLLEEKALGGFHFNDRRYADDDLIVGSSNPQDLFLIFHELVNGGTGGRAADVAYMLDQSHVIEPKIEAMILSVLNVQTAYAKALLVDTKELAALQQAGDVLGAHSLLMDAFQTDVRPGLAAARLERGLPEDALGAYRSSGHARKLAVERADRSSSAGGLGGG